MKAYFNMFHQSDPTHPSIHNGITHNNNRECDGRHLGPAEQAEKPSQEIRALIDEMVAIWPSAVVSRSEIGKFSGGVLHPRTMANKDSAGEGIKPAFKCGRKVFYKTIDVARYLARQAA